jgi:hypothetical protein
VESLRKASCRERMSRGIEQQSVDPWKELQQQNQVDTEQVTGELRSLINPAMPQPLLPREDLAPQNDFSCPGTERIIRRIRLNETSREKDCFRVGPTASPCTGDQSISRKSHFGSRNHSKHNRVQYFQLCAEFFHVRC